MARPYKRPPVDGIPCTELPKKFCRSFLPPCPLDFFFFLNVVILSQFFSG